MTKWKIGLGLDYSLQMCEIVLYTQTFEQVFAARCAVNPSYLNCVAPKESRGTAAIFLKHKQEQRVDKSYQRTATVGESKYN